MNGFKNFVVVRSFVYSNNDKVKEKRFNNFLNEAQSILLSVNINYLNVFVAILRVISKFIETICPFSVEQNIDKLVLFERSFFTCYIYISKSDK